MIDAHPAPGSVVAPPAAALRSAAGWNLAMLAGVALAGASAAAALDLPWTTPALALAVALAMATAVTVAVARADPPTRFAVCSRLTLARAGLAALLAGLLAAPAALTQPAVGWGALALALLALALDGADGWLARRRGEATEFGARFDMEADAALILVLAALAFAAGKAGVWVLALGLMRYGFVAAGRLRPRLAAPLPPSFRRKTICVLQVAVLAALLAPVLTPPVSTALAAAALAALAWSFAVDLRWLERHGHSATGRAA